MSQADTSHVSHTAPQSIPGAIIDIVVAVVRAFMGSLLGHFHRRVLRCLRPGVPSPDISLDIAITSVAHGHERDAAEPRCARQPGIAATTSDASEGQVHRLTPSR
jgi:hypothetical protein